MTDNTEQREKHCKDCDTVKLVDTSFYKAGNSYQSRCKKCHNKHRQVCRLNNPNPPPPKEKKPRKKKLNYFQKLSEEEQDKLLKYYKTMTLTKLSLKCDVKLTTLRSLHTKGQIKREEVQ